MSALTASGEWPLVTPRTRTSNDDKRSDDTPRPSHWLSAGALCLAGVGLVTLAGIVALIASLAEANGLGSVGHSLLMGITACLLCAAAGALVGAWMLAAIRAQRRHDLAVWAAKVDQRLTEVTDEVDQATTAMACTVSRIRVALDELPEHVRDLVSAQGRAVMVVTDGISQQVAGLEAAVRDLGERLERIEAVVDGDWLRGLTVWAAQVEQRVESVETALTAAAEVAPDGAAPDGDDRYLAGYADGLAGRTLGEGAVVPINGNGYSHGRR